MAKFSQDDRPLSIDTPLGKDTVVLTGFKGTEQMSGLFHFTLDLLSNDGGIKAKDLLGKGVTFKVIRENGQYRAFHGIVRRLGYGGKGDRGHIYNIEVVPWLWFLTRTTDCRIFQEKSIPDILSQVFKDLGHTEFQNKATGTHNPHLYCVQYRETDFDFASRLMEEEGMYYYFKHDEGSHKLILGDDKSGYMDIGDAKVQLKSGLGQPEFLDQLQSWEHMHEFRSGKWAHTDYDMENASTSLMTNVSTKVSLTGNSAYEFYDYPGYRRTKADLKDLATLRMEEEESRHNVIQGTSYCRTFSPGGKFEVEKHHVSSEQGKYVLLSVDHEASLGGSYVSGAEKTGFIYRNKFTCIPDSVTFRPPRTTYKPVIPGFQSAVVTGPSGEEIHTDKYGRIKVQFPWDREGKKDEKTTCWVRVATPWAGKNWGMIHIPRIGQEVIVAFEEGDPDRPLCIGSVYNSDNMPPWTLPANMTQSGIMSRSTKEGSTENCNIIRFEDKKGSEEILVHAEKDLNCVIENNETRKVGFDDKDKGNQTIEVFNNQVLKVGTAQCSDGSQTEEIWKNRTQTIKTGDDTFSLDKGNRTQTIKMGNDTLEIKMGNRSTTISMGNDTTKLNMGKSETEAMQSIELKVGANSIKVDQSGVTIKGIMVKIEGTAMTQIKAPMTQVNGDGMLMLKGGIMMIG